jgi:hypothetical protein
VEAEPSVQRFRGQAQAFCEFIDSLREGKPVYLYRNLLELLSELACAAVYLPCSLAADDWREPEGLRPSPGEALALQKSLTQALSPEREKLVGEHFDSDNKEPAVRAHMLDDDLADIYGELLHGLQLYALDSPDAKAEAVWTWRFGYEGHWGRHLFRALRTVHELHYRLHAD